MKKTILFVLAVLFCMVYPASAFANDNETEPIGAYVTIDDQEPPTPELPDETPPSEPPDEQPSPQDLVPVETPDQPESDLPPEGTSEEPSEGQFSDTEMIDGTYKPAIDAMTADGILNGFEDGSFRPTDTLTREQGVKIIAYLLLGAEKAEALTYADSPYADVEADRWSAPVIVWCTEQHILHGMGDGTFRPAEKLTGAQFAKMLLCAYGLGDPERYVGDGWLLHVTEDGDAFGLFSGDESMKDNTPLERQQAALLAENARNAVR